MSDPEDQKSDAIPAEALAATVTRQAVRITELQADVAEAQEQQRQAENRATAAEARLADRTRQDIGRAEARIKAVVHAIEAVIDGVQHASGHLRDRLVEARMVQVRLAGQETVSGGNGPG